MVKHSLSASCGRKIWREHAANPSIRKFSHSDLSGIFMYLLRREEVGMYLCCTDFLSWSQHIVPTYLLSQTYLLDDVQKVTVTMGFPKQ